jgi:O-antigen ligase
MSVGSTPPFAFWPSRRESLVLRTPPAAPTLMNLGGLTESKPFPMFPIYAFWFLKTFELDIFLTGLVGLPFYRIPMLLLPVLGFAILSRGDRRTAYWPLIVFVLMHFAGSFLAENVGLARDAFKYMVYMLVLFAASVSLLDTPAKVTVVLKLYLLHFVWFGVQGLNTGTVTWHPLMNNEDSYGPLMVMAIPFAYFFAFGISSNRWRWIARGTFVLGVLGVVTSFARGAGIVAAVIVCYVVWRSPRRVTTLLALILVAIVLVPLAALFVPLDEYVAEMKSSAEGDQGRLDIWSFAFQVFLQSPVYGVGAGNFGVVASRVLPPDPTRAKGADPVQLWNAWVHNAFFQILAEEGAIGILVWIIMLAGFFWRNARLRDAEVRKVWVARGGDGLDPRLISIGLDGAMLGWLGCSVFYNQLYIHWFWTLLTISYVLDQLTRPAIQAPARPAVRR